MHWCIWDVNVFRVPPHAENKFISINEDYVFLSLLNWNPQSIVFCCTWNRRLMYWYTSENQWYHHIEWTQSWPSSGVFGCFGSFGVSSSGSGRAILDCKYKVIAEVIATNPTVLMQSLDFGWCDLYHLDSDVLAMLLVLEIRVSLAYIYRVRFRSTWYAFCVSDGFIASWWCWHCRLQKLERSALLYRDVRCGLGGWRKSSFISTWPKGVILSVLLYDSLIGPFNSHIRAGVGIHSATGHYILARPMPGLGSTLGHHSHWPILPSHSHSYPIRLPLLWAIKWSNNETCIPQLSYTSAMPATLSDEISVKTVVSYKAEDEDLIKEIKEIQQEEEDFSQLGDNPREQTNPSYPENRSQIISFSEEQEDPWKVEWDGPDDPENPHNWSKPYKMGLTAVITVLTFTVYVVLPLVTPNRSNRVCCRTLASTLPTSGIQAISDELGVSIESANLVTTVFLLGYVFGPLLWAPGSELLGRRPIFIGTMLSCSLFCLGQALATNVQTLVVTRFLSGVFASAPLTNSGGVIADLWDIVGRGKAVSVFIGAIFMGPVCGPIIGGLWVHSSRCRATLLNQRNSSVTQSYLGWRWIFWIMMITTGAAWVAIVAFLPETYAPVLLQKKVFLFGLYDLSLFDIWC